MNVLLDVIVAICAVLIFWGYCGYIMFIAWFSLRHPPLAKPDQNAPDIKKVGVFIPCYNEASLVDIKIDNLLQLNTGALDVAFYFLNGLSTDATSKKIAQRIQDLKNFYLVETRQRGKIPQINVGIEKFAEDLDVIVNTDMDAMLEPNVIMEQIQTFQTNAKIMVVGATIMPSNTIDMEKIFWQDQNLIRLLESNAYSASTVIAPCYAFKASLIERFPDDCIGDDIYISFLANLKGYMTKYISSAKGTEMRTPTKLSIFLRHKFRKGHANYVETFRFLKHAGQLNGIWRITFLTRALQLILLPWVLTLFGAMSLYMIFQPNHIWYILGVFLGLSVAMISALKLRKHMIMNYFPALADKNSKATPMLFIANLLISNLILMLIGICYKFINQTSSYQRYTT